MSCPINIQGLTTTCKDAIAGVKRVYITPFDDVLYKEATTTVSNIITSSTFKTYEFKKGTSTLTTTLSGSDINDTKSFTSDLVLKFNKITTEKRNEIENLIKANLVILVELNSGELIYLGYDREVSVVNFTVESAVNINDFNGYTITFQDLSNDTPYHVNESKTSMIFEDGGPSLNTLYVRGNDGGVRFDMNTLPSNVGSIRTIKDNGFGEPEYITPAFGTVIDLLGRNNTPCSFKFSPLTTQITGGPYGVGTLGSSSTNDTIIFDNLPLLTTIIFDDDSYINNWVIDNCPKLTILAIRSFSDTPLNIPISGVTRLNNIIIYNEGAAVEFSAANTKLIIDRLVDGTLNTIDGVNPIVSGEFNFHSSDASLNTTTPTYPNLVTLINTLYWNVNNSYN